MKFEGGIDREELPQALLDLAEERGTGILTIQGKNDIIAFAFLEGGVVSADALNQTMEDGLGQVLAEEGYCSPEEFAQLASEYQSGGGQVVELLVERGFVDRSQLLAAVRTHTYTLCRRALEWTEGEFKFYRGEEVSYEDGVEPIAPAELLIRVGREFDRDLLPGGAPTDDTVYRRSQGGSGSAEAGAAGGFDELDESAFDAYKAITGKLSLAELAETSGLPEYRVAYLLHRWEQAGLVETAGRRARKKPKKPKKAVLDEVEEAPQPKRESLWRRLLKPLPLVQGEPQTWPARLLALAFLGAVLSGFFASPSRTLLPFPWQEGLLENLERERTSADLAVLRRANEVHFLLHGRFAEKLSELQATGLVEESVLTDGAGAFLDYSASDSSYLVRSSAIEDVERGALLQAAIRGNFLLDPELEPPQSSRGPLLVLLD